MPKVTVDTTGTVPVEIYYEVHGSGPHKILFVNGMSSVAHLWDLQIDYFLKFPEFSMCIFDNRGSGLSSAPIELAYMLGDTIQSMCLVSTFCKFNGVPAQLTSLTGMLKRITPHLPTMETYTCVMVDMLFPKAWLDEPCTRDSTYATNREYANKFFNDRLSESGISESCWSCWPAREQFFHISLMNDYHFCASTSSRSLLSRETKIRLFDSLLVPNTLPSGSMLGWKSIQAVAMHYDFRIPDWHNRHVHDNIKAGLLIAQTSQPPDDLIKLASS
ncbi:hypothetical protein BASA60_011043 [Batrachochytrium salamandrivorans]|nr:hypothetical protein BASA60_011043 [Batrachochytrium salamandrivorans]